MTILTDEEIESSNNDLLDHGKGSRIDFARAIEAAVIEKIKSCGAVGFAYYSEKYKKPLLEFTDQARGYEGEWVKVPLYRIED